MSDNSTLPGTGDVYASDDIGGVKFPRVKLIYGPDGTNSGDVEATNPLPVQVPSGITLNAPSGFIARPPSGFAQPVLGTYTGFFASVALPSGALVHMPSGVRTTAYGSGAPIAHSNPFPVAVQASGGLPIAAPSGIQVFAPSGLAVTGNLSASIGTGVSVGITASGLPVSSANPMPVEVISGGDGSVQGVDAHDSPVTADPLTIGGYASTTAPAAVSAAGDATRAWFTPQGIQVVTVATPSGIPFGAFPISQATGAPLNVFARQATGVSFPVDQATGTRFQVTPQSAEVHGTNPTGGPFLQGLNAQGASPVPVASGAVVRALADTVGKQIVMPGAPISMRVQGVAGLLGTGARNVIAAQGSGFSIAVTSLSVMNGSPTYASDVVIHDGTSTLYAGSAYERGGGFAPNGGQFPLFVTGPNAALQAVQLATGAACSVNITGYKVNNP